MKNKKLLYVLLGVGAIAGFYFWNKNKDLRLQKKLGLNCKNGTKKQTVPCLVAPCSEMVVCA
jgi:hypothetical protein